MVLVSDSGLRIIGGGRPDAVDTADLARAARVLEDVAAHLDRAARSLGVAVSAARDTVLIPEGRAATSALHAALEGSASPARCADAARTTSRAMRGAVVTYDSAESFAHRAMRALITVDPLVTDKIPHVRVARLAFGVAALGAVAAGVGWYASSTVAQAALVARLGLADDLVRSRVGLVRRWAPRGAAALLADGRTELLAGGIATTLLGRHARSVPLDERVPLALRHLAWLLPARRPTVVVPRVGSAQLPVPRDTAAAVANVALSYREGTPTGLPGTPTGTISIQRLERPDGTVAWLVAIPGTQAPGLTGDEVMDNGTNARLEGGLPDDMTQSVAEAMRLAGIHEDDPVMLAGHSQGGMVAMSVAAALTGTYAIGAVVTVGSPDKPLPFATVPPSVQVLHVRADGDVIPQVDGRPNRGSENVRVVVAEGPQAGAGRVENPADPHAVARYVDIVDRMEQEADDPQLRDWYRATERILGPDGTTATTRQYVATRDPAVVAVDEATGLPRVPRLTQGGPFVAPPGRSS